jgi:ectoine hydroxylase-related dioxygenase (phytanoyl-CoA dioxygenase family)
MVVRSMGRHVQCVLNFLDNRAEDGGTVLVPAFHRHVQDWCARDPSEHGLTRQPLPWLHFPDSHPLLALAQRVPMRAGSVLIWDQTMVHGSSPNEGSGQCRMAQFLKAFPGRAAISPERLQKRADALLKALAKRGIDVDTDITEVGRKAFGLDYATQQTSS